MDDVFVFVTTRPVLSSIRDVQSKGFLLILDLFLKFSACWKVQSLCYCRYVLRIWKPIQDLENERSVSHANA